MLLLRHSSHSGGLRDAQAQRRPIVPRMAEFSGFDTNVPVSLCQAG
jgi:hypothetical protein